MPSPVRAEVGIARLAELPRLDAEAAVPTWVLLGRRTPVRRRQQVGLVFYDYRWAGFYLT